MNTRDSIRTYLAGSSGPMWACEIIAATGCHTRDINSMVHDGLLLRHTERQPHSFSVGKAARVAMTEEERAIARRASEAKRAAVRNQKRMEERRARGIPARPPRRPKQQIVLDRSHATVGGESVATFLARGGQIECLPGLKKSSVYPQRRPAAGAGYRNLG